MNLSRHNSKTSRLRAGGSALIILLFGLFWCSIVTVFDVLIIGPFIKQVRSTSFQSAPARIVKATEISSYTSGKNRRRTYGVEFQYEYTVNGTNFPGRLYTFDTSKSTDRQWVEDALREFPAGSERVAYYDPHNPAVAVLKPGISGADITRLMFITPFNLICLGLLIYPLSSWRRNRSGTIAPRIADPRRSREAYSMRTAGPVLTFFGLLLITTFIGIFIVVIPSGFHPKMSYILTVWGSGIAFSLYSAVNVYLKTKAGKYDLVIDHDSKCITVPPMHKRKEAQIIPMTDIQSIDTEEIEIGRSRNGTQNRRWQINLHTRDNQKIHLNTKYTESEATDLASTLSSKILLN